jgi:hypothetical protein
MALVAFHRPAGVAMSGTAGGAELTLPDGRTVRVMSESEAKKADSTLEDVAEAVRKEGRDLGGWTGGSIWESGEILARLLVSWKHLVEGQRVVEL